MAVATPESVFAFYSLFAISAVATKGQIKSLQCNLLSRKPYENFMLAKGFRASLKVKKDIIEKQIHHVTAGLLIGLRRLESRGFICISENSWC